MSSSVDFVMPPAVPKNRKYHSNFLTRNKRCQRSLIFEEEAGETSGQIYFTVSTVNFSTVVLLAAFSFLFLSDAALTEYKAATVCDGCAPYRRKNS